MTTLSTHVLDTAHGRPAAGMFVMLKAGGKRLITTRTNDDGRCGELKDLVLAPGSYVLEFGVAAYFREVGWVMPEPPFLDIVTIAFGLSEVDGHYHVPLLVSPYSYSTYRGS